MRRLLVGTAAGIALTLAAATGVSAYWQAQQQLDLSTTSSGDLDLSVDWQGGTTWAPIAPGITISKRATITVSGSGQTLRARLSGTAGNAAAFDSVVTRSLRLDDCTGTPGAVLPSGGYPTAGGLRPGDQVTVCVRYSMSATASSSLQGTDLTPTVSFSISQASTP